MLRRRIVLAVLLGACAPKAQQTLQPPTDAPVATAASAETEASAVEVETVAAADVEEPPPEDDGEVTMLNTKRWRYASFFNRLQQPIATHWSAPSLPEGTDRLTSVVELELDATGALTEVRLVRSCGVESADQAAIDAVRAAAPFVVPPTTLVDEDTGLVTLRLSFVIQAGNELWLGPA